MKPSNTKFHETCKACTLGEFFNWLQIVVIPTQGRLIYLRKRRGRAGI